MLTLFLHLHFPHFDAWRKYQLLAPRCQRPVSRLRPPSSWRCPPGIWSPGRSLSLSSTENQQEKSVFPADAWNLAQCLLPLRDTLVLEREKPLRLFELMLEGLVALVSSCCSFLVCLFYDFWDFLELLALAPKYDLFWWAQWGAKGRGWVGPWFHQHRICSTTPLHFFLSLSLTWRQVFIPHLSKTTTHLKNDGVWVSRMIDVATGDKCNLAILDFQLEEQIIRWHCSALKREKTSTGLSLQLLRNYDVCALQETGRGVPDCLAVK